MDTREFCRRPLLIAALAASAACTGPEVSSGPPFGPNDIVFRLQPNLITYVFDDSSATGAVHLEWISDTVFAGFNCIGFRPRSTVDTIGDFMFYFEGLNQGLVERLQNGVTDTTLALFLTGYEGTRGTYAIDSNDRLTLFWDDAQLELRYFHPSADLHFIGDTLRSVADIRYPADSVRAQWDVSWIRNDCTLFAP